MTFFDIIKPEVEAIVPIVESSILSYITNMIGNNQGSTLAFTQAFMHKSEDEIASFWNAVNPSHPVIKLADNLGVTLPNDSRGKSALDPVFHKIGS